MRKKIISALVATVAAAGGALLFLRPRQSQAPVVGRTLEEAPSSAASLSAQPHKRQRLVRPTPTVTRDVPAPDSAEAGRTPYYFVPGEALITLHGAAPATDALLTRVADAFEGVVAPIGAGGASYPAPEGAGWSTVVRLRWPADSDFEGSLARFVKIEAQVNQRLEWEEGRVATWMPNWLGTVSSVGAEWFTPGGPAAYPRPMPAPDTSHLPLTDAPFLEAWRAGVTQPVTLAILDAFPTGEALTTRDAPATLAPVMEALHGQEGALALDSSPHYATFRTGVPYRMADHGLMTSWLALEVIGEEVRERVTVEPIRVATDAGICSAAEVIGGLAGLARRAHQGEKIVALLAFVMGMGDIIPPRLRAYEEHYEALRLACLSISEAGGILLGAAGNDASGLQHPPRTRVPASFRSVIEVTAGQLEQGDLALYANQAKAICLFGGEANLQYEMADNLPPLLGPALSPVLRASHESEQPNESGWVAWAGTSFAAALAAGLTVLLVSQTPTLRMWEVRTRLRAVASDTRQPGHVPFIDLVRPTPTA